MVLALFKLRMSERFLPQWNELKEIESQLPARREQYKQLAEYIGTYREQVGELEAEVGDLRIIKDWQNANPEAPAKISQMMVDLEKGKSELAAVQEGLAKDESRLNDIKIEAEKLGKEKEITAEEYDRLKTLQTELEDSHRSMKDDFSKTSSDLESLSEKLEEKREEYDELIEELQDAQEQKAEVEKERRDAEAARDSALSEKAGLEKTVDILKDTIETMKEMVAQVETTLGDAGIKQKAGGYRDLLFPVFSEDLLPPNKRRQEVDENDALEKARDYIQSLKLVFDERIVNSFHTCLKTGDFSPITVLAGISGTGKSELPRHYADGMGIHFHLSSVQPRWDSPQDLFGFYNYLEKKYKATELARAFVEFEIYNRELYDDAAEEIDYEDLSDRSDRMLLVLLDEMNLARTEYYFSEFLSKLETRRMVDPDDDSDRRRAEIELDMGSLGEEGAAFRLYPGPNVLFVGTMNEDESTQSLSDKIIDRASILRFWRPGDTGQKPDDIEAEKPEWGMQLSTWKSWQREPDDLGNHDADISRWIGKLNDALTDMGRPFAFRVDRAIRAYIANYPRTRNDWHKAAMADQIEQRIFPKIRGVETEFYTNQLLDIGRVIDELDDGKLKDAFMKSHEDMPTFLFRGIVR